MNNPKKIILHHSLTKDSKTVSWVAIKKYHTEYLSWDDIGYHYGIELTHSFYRVYEGRDYRKQGAHVYGHNKDSLGVCVVGNFDLEKPSQFVWDFTLNLIRKLMFMHDIEKKDIYGHRDFSSRKTCPGKYFDINKFKEDI